MIDSHLHHDLDVLTRAQWVDDEGLVPLRGDLLENLFHQLYPQFFIVLYIS
jgi:hypothetical protein